MMQPLPPEIQAQIEAYLAGAMPEPERTRFEQLLQKDTRLAQELALFQMENEALDALKVADLQQKVQQWRSKRRLFPQKWWVAGTIILLAIIGWLWWQFRQVTPLSQPQPAAPIAGNQPAPAPDRDTMPAKSGTEQPTVPTDADRLALAGQVIRPLATLLQQRNFEVRGDQNSDEKTDPEPLLQARAAMAAGQLAQARDLLRTLNTDHTLYPYAQEMLAWVEYRRGNYRAAATAYRHFADIDQQADTQWRLLHFYLADWPGSQTAFRNLLAEILRQPEHPWHTKARQLQVQLRRTGLLN